MGLIELRISEKHGTQPVKKPIWAKDYFTILDVQPSGI
jgi:hypothetical protein